MQAAWPPAQQRPAAGERGGQGPEDWAPSAPSHEERASPARLRATLVVNPRSGRLARRAAGIADLAAAAAGHFDLLEDPAPDLPIEAQLARAVARKPAVLLVAGGDGTVAAGAAAVLGTGIALGVIPGGTMNRLAGRLGLPADPIAAVAALAGARPVPLAAGRLGDRLFLYQAVLGRPARLARFREMQREGGRGWWPLLLAWLRSSARPFARSLSVTTGHDARLQAVAAVVSVPTPEEATDGLRIDVVQRAGLGASLRQSLLWMMGRLAAAPEVEPLVVVQGAIGGRRRRVRAMVDGEMLLFPPPVRLRFVPRALTVLKPAG